MNNGPTKLSNHFYLYEFVVSPTAERNGINNTPPPAKIDKLIDLCVGVLEPARELLGIPISISSGYRSPALNKKIRGASKSQHCKGEAADVTCRDNRLLFDAIRKQNNFDQLIYEFGDDYAPSWVHVSYKRESGRRQVLRATKDDKGISHYAVFNEG